MEASSHCCVGEVGVGACLPLEAEGERIGG